MTRTFPIWAIRGDVCPPESDTASMLLLILLQIYLQIFILMHVALSD